MQSSKELTEHIKALTQTESNDSEPSGLEASNEDQRSSGTGQTSKQESSIKREERMYIAIARVRGELVGEDEKLFIVTDDDSTKFTVTGIRPGKLAIRLIAMSQEERKGLISFWPRSDGSVVIASLISSEKYAHSPHTPQPNEMLLSGKVKRCHSDKFTVQVRKNKGNGRGNRKFIGTVVTVSSSAPPSIQVGQWVDLKLQRSGGQWLLPENIAAKQP